MDLLKRGWLVIRRRWLVILTALVVALVAASLYNAAQRREYTASTDLFLRAPDVKSSASAYQGDLFSRQRGQTYAKMFKSDDLAQMVIDRLGLSTSREELVEDVSASPVKDTVLITVSVRDSNAQRAANIANAYGSVFGQYAAQVEDVVKNPDVAPLVITVKTATAADAKAGGFPLWVLASAAAVIGLLVGIGLAWFLERFDTKVRSRQQIEEVTGVPVVGNLPTTRSVEKHSVGEAYAQSEDFREAARRLSLNVDHILRPLSDVKGAPTLAVSSVDSSDGKTVVAEAIARALVDRGYDVGFIDADRRRNAESDGDVWEAESSLKVITVRSDHYAVTEQALSQAIADLKAGCDFILIDGPAFAEAAEAQMIAQAADAVLLVVRPGRTRTASLGSLRAAMDVVGASVIGVVVNQAKATNTVETAYV